MKTWVDVEFQRRVMARIEVEHDEGDDPCDLTADELSRAEAKAANDPSGDDGWMLVGVHEAAR